MSCAEVASQTDTTKPTKGLGGIAKRFSFSIKKSKFNQRFSASKSSESRKEKRPSIASTISLSSLDRSSLESQYFDKHVRFLTKDKKGKKMKVQVIEFEMVPVDEIPLHWNTQVDMEDVFNDIKKTVKHYIKNCDRYVSAMNKISDCCEQLSPSDSEYVSVTHKFDKRTIAQLCHSDARGLEHHIAPRMENTRKQVVEAVLRNQAALRAASPDKREKLLAASYAQMSHSSKLMAKTMAEGDALVADTAHNTFKEEC